MVEVNVCCSRLCFRKLLKIHKVMSGDTVCGVWYSLVGVFVINVMVGVVDDVEDRFPSGSPVYEYQYQSVECEFINSNHLET